MARLQITFCVHRHLASSCVMFRRIVIINISRFAAPSCLCKAMHACIQSNPIGALPHSFPQSLVGNKNRMWFISVHTYSKHFPQKCNLLDLCGFADNTHNQSPFATTVAVHCACIIAVDGKYGSERLGARALQY